MLFRSLIVRNYESTTIFSLSSLTSVTNVVISAATLSRNCTSVFLTYLMFRFLDDAWSQLCGGAKSEQGVRVWTLVSIGALPAPRTGRAGGWRRSWRNLTLRG